MQERRYVILCGIHVTIVGGISNAQIVTEEGKYALDAVQNNPNVEGTLASKIEKLETTSPIAVKDIGVTNVEINLRDSDNTIYYGYVEHFFSDNDIPINNVVSVIIKNWNSAKYMFSTFVYTVDDKLGFMSQTSQTIGGVSLRVAYLK